MLLLYYAPPPRASASASPSPSSAHNEWTMYQKTQIHFEDFSILCVRFLREVLRARCYTPGYKPPVPYGSDPSKVLVVVAVEVVVVLDSKTGAMENTSSSGRDRVDAAHTRRRQAMGDGARAIRAATAGGGGALLRSPQVPPQKGGRSDDRGDAAEHVEDGPLSAAIEAGRVYGEVVSVELNEKTMQQGLYKEALYYAIGIASVDLVEVLGSSFPFTQWFYVVSSK
eukprot:jgi/Bigna1/79967/fgenesh1_pg.66_\